MEILLVVGIISILAGIVIVAINPSKQLATVRNTERKSDIKQIDSALTQYYIDHNAYPNTVLGTLTEICDTGALSTTTDSEIDCEAAGLIDLTSLVPMYLTAIPVDPQASTTNGAGYSVVKTNNKIGLSAPAELNQTITIGTVAVAPFVDPPCGDPTNASCWSTQEGANNYAWSNEFFPTGIQSDIDGKGNTTDLVDIPGNNYPAAEYCDGLDQGGHQDWYLPAKDQLWYGWGTLGSGGFPSDSYWSSTELSGYDSDAWYLYTSYDFMDFNYKFREYSVRCLR